MRYQIEWRRSSRS